MIKMDVNIIDCIYLCLAVLFGVLIRFPLSLMRSSDQFGVVSKIIRQRKKKWVSYEMPDSIVAGKFPKPVFSNFLISKCPRSYWRVVSLGLNILPDVLLSIAVYLTVCQLLASDVALAEEKVRGIGFLSSLLFLSMPILLPVTSRLKAPNGRTLGCLFGVIYFVTLAVFVEGGIWLWLPVVSVAGFMTIVTSLFGLQVIIFFSVLMSAFYCSLAPLSVLLFLALIGIICPALGLKDILIFKINHYLWYRTQKEKGTTAAGRNLFLNFFAFFYYLFVDPRKALRLLLRQSPLWIALYSLPLLWVMMYLLRMDEVRVGILADPVLKFCAFMVLSSSILFVMTSTKWFSEWGQAERYYEYSSPMLVVLAVSAGVKYVGLNTDHIIAIIVLQLSVVMAIQMLSNAGVLGNLFLNIPGDRNDIEMTDFFKDLGSEVRVATIPIKLSIELSAHTLGDEHGKVSYYYRFIQRNEHAFDAFKYFQDDASSLDIFSGDAARLHELYGINHLVLDRRFEKAMGPEFLSSLRESSIVYENDKYIVYRI